MRVSTLFRLIKYVLIPLIVAVVCVVVWMLVGRSRPAPDPTPQPIGLFPELTPTIWPDPATLIRQIQSLSRLETASYSIEKVVTAESGQEMFPLLFGDRLLLVAHGQVIAGVDFSQIQAGDISVTEDGGVVIILPPAEVFVATLDNQNTYVYDRETGLVGNGSTKYLDSNRANNADPQNSKHLAAYLSSAETRDTVNAWYMRDGAAVAGRSVMGVSGTLANRFALSLNSFNVFILTGTRDVGLIAAARTSSSNVNYRLSGTTSSFYESSQTPTATSIGIFADSSGSGTTDARLAFYSIGESLDLALLDARVTTLINAIGAAIP